MALLSGSGPWGVAIGVGLMLLYKWWKNKSGGPPDDPNAPLLNALLALLKQPSAPKQPDAKPDVPAIPDQHRGPLLDALLKALGGKQ
jgi:hypothetical protein